MLTQFHSLKILQLEESFLTDEQTIEFFNVMANSKIADTLEALELKDAV